MDRESIWHPTILKQGALGFAAKAQSFSVGVWSLKSGSDGLLEILDMADNLRSLRT
jgi:hypothetical protein